MLNTRQVRMPKRKDGYTTRERGKRRQSVRQEISDTVFADARNASLVTTIARNTNFLPISRAESAASYTRVHRGARRANAGIVGTWEIYSTRNKMLVKPLSQSVAGCMRCRFEEFDCQFVLSFNYKHDFASRINSCL